MAEFKLSRIRFTWKGPWVTGTTYIKDDIVSYGGKSYVCLVGHSASASIYTDVTSGNWTLWFDGYSWKGTWAATTSYNLGNIVRYGSIVYICINAHTSLSTFEASQANWANYAVTDNWLSNWANATFYKVNDVVKYNGTIYRANTAHTSTPATASLAITSGSVNSGTVTLAFATQAVQPFASGSSITITGIATAGYNGTYTVTNCSTSQVQMTNATPVAAASTGTVTGSSLLGLESDLSKWDVVTLSDKWSADWQLNTRYKTGDVVRYGGAVYRCTAGHQSQASAANGLEADSGYWTVVIQGIDFKPVWTAGVRYKNNDLVKYGADLWLCTSGHTSVAYQTSNGVPVPNTGFDGTKFSIYIPGMEFLNAWNAASVYTIGDIVSYGGYNYYSNTTTNIGNIPSTDSLSNWTLLNKNYRIKGDYSLTTAYLVGDTVRWGGNLFTAIQDNQGADPNISSASWSLVIPSAKWSGVWTSGKSYTVGEVLVYVATSYKCILGHVASALNSPPADTVGTYWVVYAQGSPLEVLQAPGDFATYYNGTTQRLPVGTVSNVLESQSGLPVWANFGGLTGSVWYVAAGGTDAVGYGQTLQDPWGSVAYACANVVGPATIFVKTGIYNEALPISVPAGVAIVGDELRSTIIQPATAGSLSTTATAASSVSATLLNSTIALTTLTVGTVSAGTIVAGMYITGTGVSTGTYIVSNLTGTGTSAGSTWLISQSQTVSTATTITGASNLITTQSTNGLSYSSASSTGAIVNNYLMTLTGTVTGTFTAGMVLTGLSPNSKISSLNLFTATGSVVGITLTISSITTGLISVGQTISGSGVLPGTYITAFSAGTGGVGTYTLNQTHPLGVVSTSISGVSYNITVNQSVASPLPITGTIASPVQFVSDYAGLTAGTTYYVVPSTLTPTQFSVSATITGVPITLTPTSSTVTVYGGYALNNMFLLRNGCGLRNMTLRGLVGTLIAANSQGTRRPSGGAYASLDPGYGTADSSVQITTKSPYCQNVSMFGLGCIGMKIDGTLHQSGNKSIVANDFTTILSDGIGAWCTGTGSLTELVSVFSYYGYAGYLAEAGGRIRATNGNSSYGTYGVISEGYDPTEIPLSATVNNRNQNALVASVFAGQAQNKILLLEYSNAGQSYTTASFTVSGSGLNASIIADEFRDNAVFEARILGTSLAAGGSNYITAANQAQSGGATTIVLAGSDQNLSANYIGMRIIIVSGTGVGQYGYIQAYNSVNKTVTVYTESTNIPGWDHLIPGTTIASVLDSTTNYSIEPRVIFSAPGYSSTAKTLPAVTAWSGVTYTNGYYVAIDNSTNIAYSIDGTNWLSGSGLTSLAWTAVAGGKIGATSYYMAVGGAGTTIGAYSSGTPSSWTQTVLPSNATWYDLAYGNSQFVAIASGGTATAISTTGTTWIAGGALPQSTTWSAVIYGTGPALWVAISSAGGYAATSANNGVTWTQRAMPTTGAWLDVAYGNNRFVAIASASATAAYSLDGITWTASTLPSSTTWSAVSYGQGVFLAIAAGATTAATSPDGITWTTRALPTSAAWSDCVFGSPSNVPTWVAVAGGPSSVAATISTGATTLGRAVIASNKVGQIKLWEPGSGYSGSPTITITDPNTIFTANFTAYIAVNVLTVKVLTSGTVTVGMAITGLGISANTQITSIISSTTFTVNNIQTVGTFANPITTTGTYNSGATINVRVSTGVMAPATWVNRGTGYQTTNTSVAVTGNGFADVYQNSKNITLSNLGTAPSIGSALTVSGNSTTYKIVTVTTVSASVYTLQISPYLDNSNAPDHNVAVSIRQKYSQCRVTGHDFLLIGTGNQATTNYPNVNSDTAIQYQQILENNLGRVFQTSTDQDGNFKVGNLFSVQQATGTVTVSADLFNLNGLSSLTLGGVSLGTNQVIISQFSTDSYFTANSDSVVPTQKAIKTYIARNVAGGGSNAITGTVNAGQVSIGGTAPAKISSTTNSQIVVAKKMSFQGQYMGKPAGVDGVMLAMAYFAHGFKSEPGSTSTGGGIDAITNAQVVRNGANIYNISRSGT